MTPISHITTRPANHALTLGLIIIMTTTMLTTTITISSPPLVQGAFADHGQEIVITPEDVSFAPVSSGEGGNQVKVVVNYVVHDPMVTNDLVKGVMKVYSPDGTLLKTSSSPTPFPISDSHGTATHATTVTDPTIEGVIAKIVFTNPIKTEIISNELPVSVDLIRGATLSEKPQQMTMPQKLPQSESESEEPIQLSEDKPLSKESAIASSTTEEEQRRSELVKIPPIQGKQQATSTEPIPQTITDNPPIPPILPTTTATTPTITTPASRTSEEICGDGIDNDSDALIDFIDGQCNLESSEQQQQQPIPQQEQIMASSPEICDDDLDNDFDGNVDSRDEECSYITSTSSFPSPEQAQPLTDENTEREIEDTEQLPNEDLSEESGENKNSDDESNIADDDNEGEEDEDEDTKQQSDDEDSDEDEEKG
jgi:hypothetical protein